MTVFSTEAGAWVAGFFGGFHIPITFKTGKAKVHSK
jgi:hypothetical protein